MRAPTMPYATARQTEIGIQGNESGRPKGVMAFANLSVPKGSAGTARQTEIGGKAGSKKFPEAISFGELAAY